MEHRRLGTRTSTTASALGLGCMRLPVLEGDESRIDERTATEMLRTAVDAGVSYVDTAYVYHGGNSERWLGRALREVDRRKVKVATKLPTWLVSKRADCAPLFEEQCERLGTDRIDVYLLHNLHDANWGPLVEMGILGWLDELREKERATLVGFSNHGSLEIFRTVVDAYPWDLCQIQYNFMNEEVQAGTAGLRYAAERGLGVVVMEPLLGGSLAAPPPEVDAVWKSAPGVTPADAALRWVWDAPEVSVVLSGMSTLEQVRQNVRSAEAGGVGRLSDETRALIQRVREAYRGLDLVPCTRCGYCMPCPEGVDIPRNFQLRNDAEVLGERASFLHRALYAQMGETRQAGACVACGDCVDRCPQGIAIPEELARVREAFRA